MRISEIKGIERLDPDVSRVHVVNKKPEDEVGFRLRAGIIKDVDVIRLNKLGCQVTFLPSYYYQVSCRARLDLIPQVLTEDFVREAKVEAVDFRQ